MERDDLVRLIESGLSQREIGRHTGRSQAAVKWWLGKLGLRTLRRARSKADRFRCRFCGTEDASLAKNAGNGRRSPSVCAGCADRRRVEQMRRVKLRAVAHKGGRRRICGYDRCPAALQFHHRDPAKRDPNRSSFRSYVWDRVAAEIDGCDLLCANCHAEVHFRSSGDEVPPGFLLSGTGARGNKLGRRFRTALPTASTYPANREASFRRADGAGVTSGAAGRFCERERNDRCCVGDA